MLDSLASGAGNCKAMKGADADALRALSTNGQTRAQELNLGRVVPGDVTAARALP